MEPFVEALLKGEYHRSFLHFGMEQDPIKLRMLGILKCLISGYGVKSVVHRNVTVAMMILNMISIMVTGPSVDNLFASNCNSLAAAGVLMFYGDPLVEEKPWIFSACWMVVSAHRYNQLLLDIYTILTLVLIAGRLIVKAHPVAYTFVTAVILYDAYLGNYYESPTWWHVQLVAILVLQIFVADTVMRFRAWAVYKYYFYLCFLLAAWDVFKFCYLMYWYQPENSTCPYLESMYKNLQAHYGGKD